MSKKVTAISADSIQLAAEMLRWAPSQLAAFVELVAVAKAMHDKGKTEAQVLMAIRRRLNAIKKRRNSV